MQRSKGYGGHPYSACYRRFHQSGPPPVRGADTESVEEVSSLVDLSEEAGPVLSENPLEADDRCTAGFFCSSITTISCNFSIGTHPATGFRSIVHWSSFELTLVVTSRPGCKQAIFAEFSSGDFVTGRQFSVPSIGPTTVLVCHFVSPLVRCQQ